MTIIVATVAATLALVFLVMNLSLGDKHVDRRPKHLYAVADPQFVRTMSVMLGPPLTGGNRVTALLNGDQIFPAMLDAIRSAQAHDHLRDLHLLVGRRSASEFAEALVERARAGREGPRPARLARQQEDGRRLDRSA